MYTYIYIYIYIYIYCNFVVLFNISNTDRLTENFTRSPPFQFQRRKCYCIVYNYYLELFLSHAEGKYLNKINSYDYYSPM